MYNFNSQIRITAHDLLLETINVSILNQNGNYFHELASRERR